MAETRVAKKKRKAPRVVRRRKLAANQHLDDFLHRKQWSLQRLANECFRVDPTQEGITERALRNVLNGTSPSVANAALIVLATNGEIDFVDLLPTTLRACFDVKG